MRITDIQVTNFNSYKELDLTIKPGIYLISGDTGAGKSTLCDIIPWILFGKTSKNGSADDVVNWHVNNNCSGTLTSDKMTVRRRRNPNDLAYSINSSDFVGIIRGKDLKDTQKILENHLGFSYNAYILASYFHEFSLASSFFTATAKTRKQIISELADFSIVDTLSETLSISRREGKDALSNAHSIMASCEAKEDLLEKKYADQLNHAGKDIFLDDRLSLFDDQMRSSKEQLAEYDSFDCLKEIESKIESEIKYLPREHCSECGSLKNSARKIQLLGLLQDTRDKIHIVEGLRKSIRTSLQKKKEFIEFNEAKNKISLDEAFQSLAVAKADKLVAKESVETAEIKLGQYDKIDEAINAYRIVCFSDKARFLEDTTNNLLSRYFDGEFRVEFLANDKDSLDVRVHKGQISCNYTQLSKGQRQLLKLCFGVSTMISVNNQNSFNIAFFDEALDGLDDNFKTKAYSLLEELLKHYETIFVVEHNQSIKSLFSNAYHVTLNNGMSEINEI